MRYLSLLIRCLACVALLAAAEAGAAGGASSNGPFYGAAGGGGVDPASDLSLNVGSKLILDADAGADTYILGYVTGWVDTVNGGDISQTTATGFRLYDDKKTEFGTGADAWFEWDTATTPDQLSLNNTDCDGGGTNCVIFYTEAGSPNLFLRNGEFVHNETDGKITLGGSGGTNNENLVLDFETTANAIDFSTTSGATVFSFREVMWLYDTITFKTATAEIAWENRFRFSTNADGQVTLENNARSSGATLDVDDAADTIVVKDQAGTGNGNLTVTGLSTLTGGAVLPVQTAATPSAPATCDASAKGRIEVVDDSDDGAGTEVCYCGMTDDTTYDWLNLTSGAACTFY